jgi:Ca2+-binding RTX toxin-like protein
MAIQHFHITAATSIDSPSGDAFSHLGPATLLIDADAFIIAETSGVAARLRGAWTINIMGELGTFALNFGIDLAQDLSTDISKITVAKTGDVFGAFAGMNIGEPATIVNFGTVTGGIQSIKGNFETHLTNAGTLIGDVIFAEENDSFTNFKKVHHVIKNGTVVGVIDLDGGDDHFNGGAKAETVRDGAGGDSYKLGGGNDTYIAVMDSPGVDSTDIVNGGKGIDTYDASAGTSQTISLKDHLTIGSSIGSDTLIGFENIIGGNGGDSLIGSNAANHLTGGTGGDVFDGLGGRDILFGGAGSDSFRLLALSDSGPNSATRDVVLDFTQGQDQIDIEAIDAKTGVTGVQAFTLIGVHNFHGVKGELRESFSNGNTIISGDVNGDGHADFSIALKGHFLLSTDDFTNVL